MAAETSSPAGVSASRLRLPSATGIDGGGCGSGPARARASGCGCGGAANSASAASSRGGRISPDVRRSLGDEAVIGAPRPAAAPARRAPRDCFRSVAAHAPLGGGPAPQKARPSRRSAARARTCHRARHRPPTAHRGESRLRQHGAKRADERERRKGRPQALPQRRRRRAAATTRRAFGAPPPLRRREEMWTQSPSSHQTQAPPPTAAATSPACRRRQRADASGRRPRITREGPPPQ